MTRPAPGKRPRGRPRLSEDVRVFRLRVSREQIDAWIEVAEAQGITVSEWARGVLDRAARRQAVVVSVHARPYRRT